MRTRAYFQSMNDPYAADPALLEELARARWGPTAFRCPKCEHTGCWRVKTRPRVRQCSRCRKVTSVTSGTLLHGTHLPLAYWKERGEAFETCARIPTCSELAYDLGISRATAWLLNQKMFALAESCSRAAEAGAAFYLAAIRVRRPRPTPRMNEAAPLHVRGLHDRHREGRVSPVTVDVSLHFANDTIWPDKVALSPEELRERQMSPPDHLVTYAHWGLGRWLRYQLVQYRHTVSLRWLPRWLQAVTLMWRSGDNKLNPPRWDLAAIRCGAHPLRTLDPWASTPARMPRL